MAWVEDIFIHTEFFANAHNIWSCVANLGLCAREREWRGDVGQSRRCQPVNLSVLSTSKRADEITYCTLSMKRVPVVDTKLIHLSISQCIVGL